MVSLITYIYLKKPSITSIMKNILFQSRSLFMNNLEFLLQLFFFGHNLAKYLVYLQCMKMKRWYNDDEVKKR